MVNCINLIIEMSPCFILGRENVPCVAEVVNRSLKADCTDYTPSWLVATPWLVPILLRPLVKVRGSSPRRGSSPLLIVPTPEGWKAEYTLANRMQIHESLTVLALLARGEARTSDPWICSLMLYHLSYLTKYIHKYIHIYI